ncbi:ddb1 and cul4 associated factor 7 [Dissophora globulifera]|uniref:Ddb1 and cul4 associated factor 7 n=1 Tax=Dissophora globulifera TaxID=979702 RepID=A0A9P6RW59_9FUNG|nr:ddb1 and cul4 associated factor 7 [Dissophora globulifera]
MASPQSTAGPSTFGQGYMSPSSTSPSAAAGPASLSSRLPRKEILNYSAPWPVYGLDWSNQPTEREALRLAVGSFIEDGSNKIQIITLPEFTAIDGKDYNPTSMSDWVPIAETNHQQYPVTKIKWEPYKSGHRRSYDLLATSGDYLRLWDLKDDPEQDSKSSGTIGRRQQTTRQQLAQRAVLANTKANFCAPLTSFDWNTFDPALIVTSSIDTTCTVWNVETNQAKTQLIAHDKEVYDVTFANNNADIFASVGADGSVRMFDLRALEHSTIIYETTSSIPGMQPNSPQMAAQPPIPLLRLSFNKLDANYLSTFHMDSSTVQILDIRVPGIPISELRGHKGAVNCMAWSPSSGSEIATGSDDHQVFIWEVNQMQRDRGDEIGHHHHHQHHQHHAKSGSNSSNNGGNPKSPVPSALSTRVLHEPYRAANVGGEVNQIAWSSASPEWVAVGFGRTVQALRL